MITSIDLQDVTAGSLARLFARGNIAVLIRCPDTVSALWRELLEKEDEQLPWQAPLINIARNYHGSGDITTSLGDLFYFQPGKHGYIARKMALTQTEGTGKVSARPASFYQDESCYIPAQTVLDQCWSLGKLLMTATIPDGALPASFEVAVQRLKYQETAEDFASLGALARNSMGRWGRAGCALDEQRWQAAGVLTPRGLSDLYGLLMQVPLVRRLVRHINDLLLRRDASRRLAPDQRVIEGAHYDHRYVTALCGRRSKTMTQVFAKGQWHDLSIDLNSLAVFPGTLASRAFGLPKILHRVVHLDGAPVSGRPRDLRTEDVTLLIGVA